MPLLEARRPRVREEFNGSALRTEWQKTDTENKLSTAGGLLVCAGGKASPAFNDPRTWLSTPLRALAGLTAEFELTWTAFGAGGVEWGLDAANPPDRVLRAAFACTTTGQLQVQPLAGAAVSTPITLVLGTSYRFRIICPQAGRAGLQWWVSQDGGATWQCVWVDATTVAGGPYRLAYNTHSAAWTSRFARVFRGTYPAPVLVDTFATRAAPGRADTGQPWLCASSTAVPAVAGDLRIPAGQTQVFLLAWTGVSDGVWEADVNFGSAPNTSKRVIFYCRLRDGTNGLRVIFERTGSQISVARYVGGTSTTVGSPYTGSFLNNTPYHFTVVLVGPTIKVYQDGVERLSIVEPYLQYATLGGVYLQDDLATPDIRLDTLRVWGTPQRPLLMDTFDRPDSLTTLGAADSGQAYTPVSDVASSIPTWGVEQGRARLVDAPVGSSDKFALVPLGRANYVAHCLIRSTSVGLGGYAGMLVRWQGTQDFVYVRVFWGSVGSPPQTIMVFKDVGGVRNNTGSVITLPALNANQDYLLSVLLIGNTLEVYLDGVRYISVTEANFPQSPAGGPFTQGTNASLARMDDLRYAPLSLALAHDTFTRADSATTAGSTETPGTAWVPLFSGTWGIASNQLYNVDTATGRGLVVPVLAPDVDVSADLVRQAGTVGLLARCDAAGTNYLRLAFDGTTVALAERVAGAAPVTVMTVPYTWTAGATPKAVRVRVYQGVLSAWVDGGLVLVQAFTGHATAADSSHGLYNLSIGATTNRFDSFLIRAAAGPVQAVLDTFSRADSAVSLGATELPVVPWNPIWANSTWGIASNQAYEVTGTAGRGVHIPFNAANPDVSATITRDTNGVGLIIRSALVASDYIFIQFNPTTCSVRERVANGSITTLGSVAFSWAAGLTKTVRASLVGTALSVAVDGAPVLLVQPITGHDGANERNVGLYASTAGASRFDTFLVSAL